MRSTRARAARTTRRTSRVRSTSAGSSAAGLDPSIPWYQAIGNHDHFWIGTLAINDYLRDYYVGDEILNLGNVFTDHPGVDSRGFYMGSIDGRTPLGDVFGVGPVADFSEPPRVRSADPRRRSLRKHEWISEFLTTTSNPVGHGFTQANVDDDFACYTFEPNPDLPLTVIVLDDTQRDDDADVGGYGGGYLDQQRYDWLVAQLAAGQDADRLMIIACHIPIGVEKPGSPVGWSSLAALTEEALFATLHDYPNLLLWVAGHRHLNTVTAFGSPDAERPELGFWQVETSSLRDFPQQFRTIEIVRNGDGTLSILAEGRGSRGRRGLAGLPVAHVRGGRPAAVLEPAGRSAERLHQRRAAGPAEPPNAGRHRRSGRAPRLGRSVSGPSWPG